MSDGPRMALAHEWLAFRHGSEKTFEQMAAQFPAADLYALTMNQAAGFDFVGRPVHTTFLDRLRPIAGRRSLQLPLMPLAWRLASRRSYEVVLTSSHACVKGFRPGRRALHLCYCYTPMRYVWLPEVDRRSAAGVLERIGKRALRRWDLRSVAWVDDFAAISTAVTERIERFYRRPARVIHPPVDTDFYTPGDPGDKKDLALAVSRFVPYKRLDLAIRAAQAVGVPLTIAGSGPEEGALRRLAADLGAEVDFIIGPTDEELRDLYRSARVCLFPAEEDFGIVAAESQACGTPVVALGRGGSLDTVIDRVTGVHIAEQSVEALAGGMRSVLEGAIDPVSCRRNSERFSTARFRRELHEWVCERAGEAGIELP